MKEINIDLRPGTIAALYGIAAWLQINDETGMAVLTFLAALAYMIWYFYHKHKESKRLWYREH